MKGTWKALAFLVAVASAGLALSTSALAVGAGSSHPQAQWKATLGRATWSGKLTALYPGATNNTELIPFVVTNASNARQRLNRTVASVPETAGGDAQTAAGADIRGCRATWFAVIVDHADRTLPLELARSASYRGKVELTMRDTGANQDACKGASPAITVTVR